jgi:hypothetical protein
MCSISFIEIASSPSPVCEYLLAKFIIFVIVMAGTTCIACSFQPGRLLLVQLLVVAIAFEAIAMTGLLVLVITIVMLIVEMLCSMLILLCFGCISALVRRAEEHGRFPFSYPRFRLYFYRHAYQSSENFMATIMVVAAGREALLWLLERADECTETTFEIEQGPGAHARRNAIGPEPGGGQQGGLPSGQQGVLPSGQQGGLPSGMQGGLPSGVQGVLPSGQQGGVQGVETPKQPFAIVVVRCTRWGVGWV